MKKNKLFLTLLGLLMLTQLAFAQSGSTFTNSDTIPGLPYFGTGHTTCGYGDNYTTADISCVGNFMSGDERIYSFTPSKTYNSVEISITNISDNFSGLFIMSDSNVTGTCMASLGNPTSNDRVVSNLQLMQGSTYYIIVSTWANPQCISSYDIEVIDNSCPAPSALSSTGATKNDMTLSWVENGAATQWVVEYGPIGFLPGAGTVVPAGTNPFVLTGLTSGTDYDWYLRADCGVDSSYAVGPENFTTLPDLCAGNLFYDNGGAFSNYANNSNDTTVICPNNAGDLVNLTFNQFSLESGYDYLKIYDGNTTSGTLLGNFSGTTIPGPFLASSTSGCLTLVFTSDGSVSRPGWEASVVCMPPPTCPVVDSLAVSSIIQNSATLSWVELGTATQWEVQYGGVGFTIGTGTSVTTTTNPVTVTGLVSSTSYEFYVRAICGVADSSLWVGPFGFSTPCGMVAAPITESFNSAGTPNCWSQTATSGGPWVTTGTPGYGASGVADHTGNGGNFIWMDQSSTDLAVSLITYDVDISALTAPFLEFYYYTNNTNDNSINDLFIEAWNGSAWTSIDTISQNTGGWMSFGYSLTGYTFNTNTARIRFRAESGGSTTDYYQDQILDDISFKNAPSCPDPSTLLASTMTLSSASLSWVEQGSATQWQIEYGVSGYVFGTGIDSLTTANPKTINALNSGTSYDFYVRAVCSATDSSAWVGPYTFMTLISCPVPTNLTSVVSVDTATFDWIETGSATLWEYEYGTSGFAQGTGTSDTTSTHPVSVTGLNSSTDYQVYVRSICGAGDTSTWVGPTNFTTPCGVYTPRYSESFATWAPNCWSQATNGDISTGPTGSNSSLWRRSTALGNSVAINLYTTSRNDWAISPAFDLSGGTYQVKLDVAVTNWQNAAADAMGSDDSVRLAYTDNGTTWTVIKTWTAADNLSNTLTSAVFPLTSTGTNVQFALFATDGPVNDTEDYDFHFSNFVVEIPPLCAEPISLNVTNVGSTSAIVGWTEAGSATQWEVEYGATGFAIGSGIDSLTTNNPLTLNGLTAMTGYDFYVRAVCGAGDTSIWSGPIGFTTLCGAVAAPYFDSVETHAATSNSTIANCWTSSPSGTTGDTRWNVDAAGSTLSSGTGPSGAYSGTTFFYLETSQGSTGDMAELMSPLIDVSGLTLPRLQFMYHMYGATTNKLVIEAYDGSNWNAIDSIVGEQHNSLTDPWTQRSLYLAGYSGNIQIRFKGYRGTSYTGDISLDDIKVNEAPTCPEPFALAVSNVASTSVNVGWTEPGSATQWEVEYGAVGFVIGSGIDSLTNNNPLTITGLTSFTSYDFYVRTVCGAGDTSVWAGPYNFQTSPDFCGGDHFFDNGGSTGNYANSSNETTVICASTAGNLVSVSFNSFDLENNFDYLSIYDGNSTAGTLLGTFTGTTVPGTFDASTTSGCLTFVFTSDGSVARAGWDATISCNPPPSCRKPASLAATSITSSSAMTDWVELGTATTWHVEYGLAGFVQGTGMLDTTTVDSLMLTGLNAITDYEFYVRSSCSATDSSTWAGPFSFTTECATIDSYPYLETFDILSPSIRCWNNNQITGSGNWSLYTGAAGGSITGPVASGYYAGFVSNFGTNSPITNLESPELDLTSLVFPRMSFWYAQEANGSNQNYTRVLYRISSSDPWVELWSDSTSVDVWTQVVLDLPNPSATYQVAFQGINNGGRRNVIDEFEVFDIDPKDLSVINVDIVNPIECGLGTDSVRATIVNYGSQIQNSFDLGYTFDGVVSTPVTVNTTIGILDTVVYTFASTVNFTTSNSYELSAYTILIGDTINGNDTATKFVGKTPMISSFPYSEDYANGPAGWIIDNNVNGSWEFGTPVKSNISGAASDSNAFVIGGLTGNYNSNEDGFVYSPCFDFSSLAKPQVQMSIWYESEYGWDGANLQYSTDGGINWNVVGNLNTGENWYTDNSINGMNGLPAWTGRGTGFGPGSGGWITATHDAGFLSGETDVKFRVAFGSDGIFEDEGFAFDDFAIFEGPELGADTVLCSDESIILDPGAFDGYYWTDSSITATNFVEANALADGTYDIVVIVSGVGGYKMYDTINVIVEKPVILLGNDTVVCYGTSILLDAGTGFNTYSWSNSATTQTTISAPAPSGNTNYYVNAVTDLGCVATDTISVNVNTQVVVDLGVDTTFFDSVKQDVSYTLDAGPGFVSYLWSTGDTTQTIVVDSLNDGTISVTVTNNAGCIGTDEVIVNFVLGVNSSFEVSTLTMYPNPATDQITIDVTNFSALDVINVTIVDITGKIVMVEKLEGLGNSFNETYDVSSFATGTYFVQFEANGEVVTRQFVIK